MSVGPRAVIVGGWNGGATGYVGLEINGGSGSNYGWAQISYVDNFGSSTLTLIDFAYETTTGVGIETGAIPEPTNLALLVAGAAGLLALRRSRQKS